MEQQQHADVQAATAEVATALAERYRASMVLAGVGDAMGYRNGAWEFTFDGTSPSHSTSSPEPDRLG